LNQSTQFLQSLDEKIGICLIAVDEAHYVSQWGHDFRVTYRNLGDVRLKFAAIPFMALTATASANIQNDVEGYLKLKQPSITITPFDRQNLFLSIRLKTSLERDLLPISIPGESTIIYCSRRDKT
jgi:superfamily II DNA helicase RecQ